MRTLGVVAFLTGMCLANSPALSQPEGEMSNSIQTGMDLAQSSCTVCPNYDLTLNAPSSSWQIHPWSVAPNGCKIYRVQVQANYLYTFKTGCGDGASADFDTVLTLYNGSCTQVAQADGGCESLLSKLEWTSTFTGYAYLKVSGQNGLPGNYTLVYKSIEPKRYLLNTGTYGSGVFHVTPAPGTDGKFAEGTIVSLSVANSDLFRFVRWYGHVGTFSPQESLVMNGDKIVFAHFAEGSGMLNLMGTYPDGAGSTQILSSTVPARGYTNNDPNKPIYPFWTVVTVRANPNSGCTFIEWWGHYHLIKNNPVQMVINGDKNAMAHMTCTQYALTRSVYPAGAGTIVSTPNSTAYAPDALVLLQAVPNPGWQFVEWWGHLDRVKQNPSGIVMNGPKTVIASFRVAPSQRPSETDLNDVCTSAGAVLLTLPSPAGSPTPKITPYNAP